MSTQINLTHKENFSILKKTIKHIISFLLIFAMVFVVGCSGADTQSQSSIDTSSTISENDADVTESSAVENSTEDSSFEISSETAESSEAPESSVTESPEAPAEDSSTEESVESSEESSEPESIAPEVSEPEQSEPEEHTCDFKETETIAPTCTDSGYTLSKCQCGKTQKTNEVPALGHKEGDWVIVKEATTSATGLKQKTCTRCKAVVKEETIPKIVVSDDPFDIIPEKYNVHPKGNQKLVEEAVEYYLNLYREKDGVAKATRLSNKTYEYATRRAVQLSTNFDHDYEDIFKVCNELKFGQYNPPAPEKIINWDTGEVTYTGEMTPEYYFGGFSEACSGPVTNRQTVDNVARAVAYGIYNSSNHWSYVGASTTKYITVGAFDQYDNGGKWYICIATGDTNSKKYDAWDYDDKEYYQE